MITHRLPVKFRPSPERVRRFSLWMAIGIANRLRYPIVDKYILRALVASDQVTKKPSADAIRDALGRFSNDVTFMLLDMTPKNQPSHGEINPVFELVGDRIWTNRASRVLLAWSKRLPSNAINSCTVWLFDPAALSVHQLRIALRLTTELADLFEQSIAQLLLTKITPIALQRSDPYSTNAVLPAQEALATLLAEYPEMAIEWAAQELTSEARKYRREILIRALSAERKLTVRSHFGALAGAFDPEPPSIHALLRRTDDKYSVADQCRPTLPKRRLKFPKYHWIMPIFAGILLSLLVIMVSSRLPLTLEARIPSVLDAFIPLLGIIVAVHLLAIDLASNRLPRLAIVVIATSPRILFAYGFLTLTIAFSYVGSAIYSLDADADKLWKSLSLTFAFAAFALVILDLLQAQDVRHVARSLAARSTKSATLAGREHAAIHSKRPEIAEQLSQLRNIRTGFAPPIARQTMPVRAKRSGVLRLTVSKLQELDTTLDNLRPKSETAAVRRHEILLIRNHGSEVVQGDLLATIVSDELEHLEALDPLLRSALRVNANSGTVRTSDAMIAISRILESTIRESSTEASQDILKYISDLITTGVSQISNLQDRSQMVPFSPGTKAVLALERSYRQCLRDGDPFMRENASRALITLSNISRDYPQAGIVELVATRLQLVAEDFMESREIGTVVATWAEVATTVFTLTDGSERRRVITDIGDICERIAANESNVDIAAFCVERFAETLAAAMYSDYFAASDVLLGVRKLSSIFTKAESARIKYTVAISIMELGAAALECGRFSVSYQIAGILASTGVDLDKIVESVRRAEVSSRMQVKSNLAGEAFGRDVEAAAIAYREWVSSLPVLPSASSSTGAC